MEHREAIPQHEWNTDRVTIGWNRKKVDGVAIGLLNSVKLNYTNGEGDNAGLKQRNKGEIMQPVFCARWKGLSGQ